MKSKKYITFFCIITVLISSLSFNKRSPDIKNINHIDIDTTPSGYFFDANTMLSKVQINKEDPTDVKTKIKITWECNYCSYVLIEGLDSLRHEPKGGFETDQLGFSYNIIGIKGNSVSAKYLGGAVAFKPGTGLDGRIFFIKNTKLFLSLKKSWKYPFTSNKSLQKMEPEIIKVLQSFNYQSETESDGNTLLLECEPYQSNPLICLGEDCKLPIGGRRIERKMSIMVNIEKRDKDYMLLIQPSVLRNFRKQDNEWSLDPDFLESSKIACDSIAKKLIEKL